jgi:hypothetical protein
MPGFWASVACCQQAVAALNSSTAHACGCDDKLSYTQPKLTHRLMLQLLELSDP